MPNPNNVKPYGDLVRRAAQSGGVDAFQNGLYTEGKHDGYIEAYRWAMAAYGIYKAGSIAYRFIRQEWPSLMEQRDKGKQIIADKWEEMKRKHKWFEYSLNRLE